MVPTLSSCPTRRIETAWNPSASAMTSAAAAIVSRLSSTFALDIRTLYHYIYSYRVRNRGYARKDCADRWSWTNRVDTGARPIKAGNILPFGRGHGKTLFWLAR